MKLASEEAVREREEQRLVYYFDLIFFFAFSFCRLAKEKKILRECTCLSILIIICFFPVLCLNPKGREMKTIFFNLKFEWQERKKNI